MLYARAVCAFREATHTEKHARSKEMHKMFSFEEALASYPSMLEPIGVQLLQLLSGVILASLPPVVDGLPASDRT